MADAQANLNINIDTSSAIGQIKALQSQISQLYATMATGGATARAESAKLTQNLLNSVNATGKFSASMTNLTSSSETFTNALEKNKLSMGEYFRYAGGASQTFGKLFRSEFNTIEKVARERVKTLQTQYIKMGRDANGAIQGIAVRPLSLDMKNLGTQVMMTAQKQQIFNQLLKQGTTNLLNFGKNTQWAGRQLMVGFTIPLTILGTTAARVFMELEEQTIRFKRVYGEFSTSAEEVDKMAEKLKDLAGEFTKYGVAVKDTLAMAADAAAMGKMGNDLLAQVEQASRLAVLGGVEQQQALETTISLTNAFGVATEDLAGKISFLNAVENQTVVSIEDLTVAIPKAGPVVQQLGGDVEDLAFFLTAMKEGGINASEGANALKSGLASLINPSGKASEMLAGLGININSIVEGNAGNVKGIVVDFAKALDTLDPLNRARAIEQLFGKFQFSRISTLFQNVIAQGSQASRVLELTGATTEELGILAERELSRVEESTGYKFKKAIEDVTAALAPVGEEFLKAITPFISIATDILKWFNSLGDGAKQFGVIAIAAVGVIAPTFLMLFGLVANGFANFIKGVSLVGRFLNGLSGQTKIVGGGISYMTQEQLESAAVAASLEQVHQRLVQLFTSEAGTVDRLAAAYARAVPALRNFNTAAGGAAAAGAASTTRYNPFLPPKKYADGVTMVPGPKGKGDIVPAMLTPGEAVIPADQTAKYFPLIKGIIADNLPGYSDGVNMLGKQVFSSNSSEEPGMGRLADRLNRISTMIPGVLDDFADTLVDGVSVTADTMKKRLARSISEEQRKLVALAEYTEAGGASDAQKGMVGGHTGGKTTIEGSAAQKFASQMSSSEAKKQMERGVDGTLYSELVLGITAQENANLLTGEERASYYRNPENQQMVGSYLQDAGYIDLEDPVEQADFKLFTQLLADKLEQAGTQAVTEVDYERMVTEARNELPDRVGPDGSPTGVKAGLARAENTYKTFSPAGQDKTRYEFASGEALVRDPETRDLAFSSDAPGRSYQARSKKLRTQFSDQAELAALGNVQGRAGALGFETNIPQLEEEYGNAGEKVGRAAGDGVVGGAESSLQIASPSKKMFDIGKNAGDSLAQGFEQSKAGPQGQKRNPLAPPPPPAAPNVTAGATSRFGRLKAGMRNAGNRVTDTLLGTSLGQKTAQYFADASGGNIIDSKGNVRATARSVEEIQAEEAAKAKKPKIETYDESQGEVPEGMVVLPNGQLVTKKQADKITKEEKSKQNRARRSGVAAGILGTATMAVGMATQVDAKIFGFNIGEMAQKLMPVVGGLAMLAPILLAMSGSVALITLILGGLAAGYILYQKRLKEVTSAARELAQSLGSGKKAMGVFAEFAGTVSATELMNRKRQLGSIDVVLGKSEFGETFMASEQGQAYVEEVRKGFEEFGKSGTIEKLGTQLSTAVFSGILTMEQAAGIASELGRTLGDTSVSISVLGELTELLGPGGEDILNNPLEVKMRLIDASVEDIFGSGGTVDSLLKSITDPENASGLRGFIDAMFTTPELEAQLAGELVALAGQRQEILDADQVAFDKRIATLKEEEASLREQGKITEANRKLGEIDAATNKFWEDRAKFLDDSNVAANQFANKFEEIRNLQADIEAIGNINYIDETELGPVRQALKDYEALTGTKLDIDIDTASMKDLKNAFRDIDTTDLDKVANSFQETFVQVGEVIKTQFENSSDAVKKEVGNVVDSIVDEASNIPVNLKLNLLTGIQSGSLGVGSVADFLQKYVANEEGVTQDQIDEFQRANFDPTRTISDEEAATGVANEGRKMQENVGNIMEEMGPGAGQQLLNVFDKVDDVSERLLARNLSDAVNIGTPRALQGAQSLLDTVSAIAAYGENTIDVDAAIKFFVENPEVLADFNKKMSDVDALISKYGEDLTAEVTFKALFVEDSSAFNTLMSQAEYFNGLPSSQQKLFVSTFLTQFLTSVGGIGTPEGDAEIAAYRAKKSAQGGGILQTGEATRMTDEEVMAQIALEAAQKVTEALRAAGFNVEDPEGGPDGGGGGGPTGSWLDPIVKSSRDVGNANQELTTGFEASLDAILNMVDGVAWATNGLAGQLRNADVPESLIQKFLGMDPEEWEKTKKTLFDVDNNLTAQGKKVMEAYDSSIIANKKQETESETESTNDQVDAYNKLTKAGYSTAEAFQIVQDKEVAGAITRKGLNEETKALVKSQKELNKAQEEYEEISEKQRISDSVRKMNKDFKEQINLIKTLTKRQKEYTDAQIEAILNNKDLGKLLLKPKIDQKAFEKALEDANKKVELELMIKRLTFSGRQDLFDKGIGDAMNAFGALEEQITLSFNAKVRPDSDLVKTAEEQLGLIDFELSQYQGGLTEIGFTEDLINKTYDKRLEALDKINELNQQIEQSQKSQLDLADALSKGDIAAAAKAAQEMRSTQQEDAIETQRRMMETARQTELARITSASGMNREQLEERIRLLEQERFSIEQNTLAPAQERIRLAELEKEKRIEDLRVLGKTREEWQIIQNEVAVAAANGWRLVDSVKEAMNVMQTLINDLLNRPVAAPASASSGGKTKSGPKLASKGEWTFAASDPNAGKTVADVAKEKGYAKWQDYYNKDRSIDKKIIPKISKAGGGMIIPKRMSMGGGVKGYPMGGLIPYKAGGGFFKPLGSDTIPAMLTPGEFVVRRPAVNGFGVDNLEKINRGTYSGGSMYNYNLEVNVKSDSSPEQIASTVMRSIKQVEGRRIRSTSYNG